MVSDKGYLRTKSGLFGHDAIADTGEIANAHCMTRLQMILMAAGVAIAVLVFESYFGSTRYKINNVTYVVPHKYEFLRNFSLPWLTGAKGFDKEPDDSVWLIFAAEELSQGVPGYKQWVHGYSDQVKAETVVNVLGGREAREFPGDRIEDIRKVAEELTTKNSPRGIDPQSGWDRVYWSVGQKGTPGEGHDLFYLIPHAGLERLPSDWRVPSCQSAPDINGKETYDCHLTIYRRGLTFGFYIRSENLGVANRIPDYTRTRLDSWRR